MNVQSVSDVTGFKAIFFIKYFMVYYMETTETIITTIIAGTDKNTFFEAITVKIVPEIFFATCRDLKSQSILARYTPVVLGQEIVSARFPY